MTTEAVLVILVISGAYLIKGVTGIGGPLLAANPGWLAAGYQRVLAAPAKA